MKMPFLPVALCLLLLLLFSGCIFKNTPEDAVRSFIDNLRDGEIRSAGAFLSGSAMRIFAGKAAASETLAPNDVGLVLPEQAKEARLFFIRNIPSGYNAYRISFFASYKIAAGKRFSPVRTWTVEMTGGDYRVVSF